MIYCGDVGEEGSGERFPNLFLGETLKGVQGVEKRRCRAAFPRIRERGYLEKMARRSAHFFFLMTNQNREKPPAPAVTVEPVAIAATAPPESWNFSPHTSHLPSAFSL